MDKYYGPFTSIYPMSFLSDQLKRRVKETLSDVVEDTLGSIIRKAFDIGLYTYPADLTSQDLLHYVQFNIIVRDKSEAYKEEEKPTPVDPTQGAASASAEDLETVGTAAIGFGAGAIALTLTNQLTNAIFTSGNKTINKAASVITGAAAATTGFAASTTVLRENQFLKNATYRTKDVITLHVDGPPTVRYGVNYSNKDIGMLAGLVGPGSDLFKSISEGDVTGAFNQISNTGGEVGAAFLTQLAKFPSIFGAGDARAAISKTAGVSLNPFREVIFESVDPRTFTFKYKFLPKSKTETNMVRDIINLFKYHMYPDISENKLFFIYPSEFEIKYLFRGTENEYLHTFARCALESMDVSYGGEQFSSFRDGAPTEVNMSLTFRELEVLTKQSSQIKPKYRNVIPTVTSESDGVTTTTRGDLTRIADNR